MSDERLRDLAKSKLELAAYCGSEAAARALGRAPSAEQDLVAWVTGLKRWGREAEVRAVLVCARAVADRAANVEAQDSTGVIPAIEAWLAEPTPERAEAVKAAGHGASGGAGAQQVYEFAAGTLWSRNPDSAWLGGALQVAMEIVPPSELRALLSSSLGTWALSGNR
jgi:hypothetical protein